VAGGIEGGGIGVVFLHRWTDSGLGATTREAYFDDASRFVDGGEVASAHGSRMAAPKAAPSSAANEFDFTGVNVGLHLSKP